MKNKIFFTAALILTLFMALAVVSAADNTTDVSAEVEDADIPEVLSEVEDVNSTSDDAEEPVVVKQNSTISANKTVGYKSFSTKFDVALKSENKPLSSKPVNITINGITYKKTTNANGLASVSVKLNTGTYTVKIAYGGDNTTKATSKSAKIVIKDPVKTSIKVADKDINYRQGSKCVVIVRLLDANSKPVAKQTVTFKVNGKKYVAKTNSKGYARIFVSLKKGSYKIKYAFAKNAPYLSSSGSHKIKVKPAMGKGNGYWVWSAHMKKVNLKKLQSRGTKQIFLHVHAISVYGKSTVVSWIKQAHKYGMKVHLWMQVFYSNGEWVRPVNKDGSFKYKYMNSKIAEAKKYAKIKGVNGVHLDYVRFGGTAHLYDTSTKAVNYFVKKVAVGIHKINPNMIVSAAVMPEPGMMDYYYGQDIPTMSKYVDVLLPMVYKGNYGKNTAWIKSVTKAFVGQSNGAQVWTGLQAYKSDSNPTKLTSSELIKDARAAKSGGASGVILFRYGITNLLKFTKV